MGNYGRYEVFGGGRSDCGLDLVCVDCASEAEPPDWRSIGQAPEAERDEARVAYGAATTAYHDRVNLGVYGEYGIGMLTLDDILHRVEAHEAAWHAPGG